MPEPHEIGVWRPKRGGGRYRAYCTCGYHSGLHEFRSGALRSAYNHVAAKTASTTNTPETGMP